MTEEELGRLLATSEGPKLEFKQALPLEHPNQKNELVKDIVSLANGNVGHATEPAYLIVGASDKLPPGGQRTLHDTRQQGLELDCQAVLRWVNNYCYPPLADLRCYELRVVDTWLSVIEIPPSPFVHELDKDLQSAGKRRYAKGTVLIRCGDDVEEARQEQIAALKREKESIGRARAPQVDWARYRAALRKHLESERHDRLLIADSERMIPRQVTIQMPRQKAAADGEPSPETQPWPEVVAEGTAERTVLLVGSPGTGKSVCLNVLACHLLDQVESDEAATESQHPSLLPVLVPLFRHSSNDSLERLVYDEFQRFGVEVAPDNLLALLNGAQPVMILADGLDEAAEPGLLIPELDRLMAAAHRSRFILSCRDALLNVFRGRLKVDATWEIAPLTEEQVKGVLETARKDSRLVQDRSLLDLLKNPLFLYMYAELAGQELVHNRFDLLQRFAELLFRRELAKRLQKPEWKLLEACSAVFEETAFAMQQGNTRRLGVVRFHELADNAWLGLVHGVPPLSSRSLVESLPLVTEHDDGTVSFRHAVFQDYFAARRLRKMDLSDGRAFEPFALQPQWDYAIVLLAESLQDPSALIANLVYAVPAGASLDLLDRCMDQCATLDDAVWESASNAIMAAGTPDQILHLAPWLGDAADNKRAARAEAIAEAFLLSFQRQPFPDTSSVSSLVSMLRYVLPWDSWRSELAGLDGLPISPEVVLRVAEPALSSPDPQQRAGGVIPLAGIGRWDVLRPLINDTDVAVRRTLVACAMLVSTEEPPAGLIEMLRLLCGDEDSWVQEWAAFHLFDISGQAASDALLQCLETGGQAASLAAALRLAEADDERAVPRLLRFFLGDDGEFYHMGDRIEEVLDALGSINAPAATDAIFFTWAWGEASREWVKDEMVERGDPRSLLVDWIDEFTDDTFVPDAAYERLQEIVRDASPDDGLLLRAGLLLMESPTGFEHNEPVHTVLSTVVAKFIADDPRALGRLAAEAYERMMYVAAFFAWRKIEDQLDQISKLAGSLLGEAATAAVDSLTESARMKMPTDMYEAWQYIGLGFLPFERRSSEEPP